MDIGLFYYLYPEYSECGMIHHIFCMISYSVVVYCLADVPLGGDVESMYAYIERHQ